MKMKLFIHQSTAIIISSLFIVSCQNATESQTQAPNRVTTKNVMESNETPSNSHQSISVEQALTAAKGGDYQPASRAELHQAETLFNATLQRESMQQLQSVWHAQGFTFRTVTDKNIVVVQEHPQQRTGRGFYAFRQTDSIPIALQAPHRYKDLYTGQIVRQLMQEGDYLAAAWNTVPRYGKTKSENFADMAHIENTIFQAFGRAFANQYPTGTIIQLHGFAQQYRKTVAGKTADLILSGTTRTPSQRLLDTGRCLKSKLTEFVVRIYPNEVTELGGTTNSNAKDLRERGFTQFFHVELSKPLREQLRQNQSVRKHVNSCFAQIVTPK
jgi:hypothetical protein